MNNLKNYDDNSLLQTVSNFVKNFIFGFLYILQKESKINALFLAILNLIQYIQLHSYMFREEIGYVWQNDGISNAINIFLEHLLFKVYFSSLQSYVIFLFIQTGLFISLICIIIYFGYQYHTSSYINRTASSILRVVLLLLITVLFMPIINYNTSAWKCVDDINGVSKFYDLQCFTATHIGYCIAAFLNLVLYITLCMTIIFTYFECRFRANDQTAKINGRADAIMQSYVIVQEIAFSIMHNRNFAYILLVITLGGSLIIFLAFSLGTQYHSFLFTRYHSTLSSLLMWSAFMLAVATAMEGNLIGGSIVAWLVGIPFVISIVLTQRDRQLESLVANVNKLNSPEEIISQVRYLLTLLRLQNQTKYAVILDGYIEVHRQTCEKSDCPLKKYKPGWNKRLIQQIKQNNSEVKNDKQALLILTLYRILDQGLEKFEKNVDLRIQYAFFLLEVMSYKHKALQELQKAEECEPSLDTQFVLYKYKRIVESEIQDDQNEKTISNHEILPISAAPPIISGLAMQIEKCAYLHMEYWSELNEETPDVAKLEVSGKKVTDSIRLVQELWQKLKRVCPNHQPSIMLYSAFLIEILNDKEYGVSLNDTLRKMIQGYNNSKIDDIDNHDFSNDPTPTIVLSSDNEKFGLIQQINSSGAALFHYTKSELMNQNIQILMPDMIGKSHDRFVEDFINNSDYKYVSKDRQVICKNKSGYLFQMNLNIKPINSVKNGISFLGTFTQDKFNRQNAFILVNPKNQIEGISTGCLSLLKLDIRYIKTKRNFFDLFPQITDKDQFLNKLGSVVSYTIPKEILKTIDGVRKKEEKDYIYKGVDDKPIQLQCFCQEIQFTYANFPAGYCFKFERVSDLAASQLNSSIISKKSGNQLMDKKLKMNQNKFIFQSKFDEDNIMYIDGFYKDLPSYSDLGSRIDQSKVDDSFLTPQKLDITISNKQEKTDSQEGSPKFKEIQVTSNKIRYDEGIRTVRLFQNKVGEIVNDDDQVMEEEEQEYEGNQYQGVNQNLLYDDSEEQQSEQDAFQSRTKLEQAINQNQIPFPIKFIRIAETFLTLSMLVLAFVDYFLDINQLQDIQLTLEVYNTQTNLVAEWNYLLENIRDLQLINEQLYGNSTAQIIQNETILKSEMKSSIDYIQEGLNYIILSGYQFPSELKTLYNEPNINMKFNSTNSQPYDFQEASNQLLSYALTIMNYPLESISLNSDDVALYFTIQNGFNSYLDAQLKVLSYTIDDFISKTADKSTNFVIIVVVAGVILALSLAIVVIILLSTRLAKEQVIIMFLELPSKVVKALFNKCEAFVKYVNSIDGEGSEKDEDFEHQIEQDDMAAIDSKKKKKKKFKNTTKAPIRFYIQVILIAGFMEAYFIMQLVLQKQNLSDVRQLIYEANSTIMAEGFYAFCNNVQQAVLIDSTLEVQSQPAVQTQYDNLYRLYQLDSTIHKEHSSNIDKHEQVYIEAYNTIMFSNPCQRLNEIANISITDCESFAETSVKSGFTVALTRFFENLRYLSSIYTLTIQNPTPPLSDFIDTEEKIIFENEADNLRINLMKLSKMQEVKQMQRIYFKTAIRYLGDSFIEGSQVKQNTYLSQKLGLFITFMIIIILIYLLYWIPFHRHLNRDIWKTRMTLLMIPVDNIRRLRNAKAYLKVLINQQK
ncbi:unnamed protein product [Paramecium pentaurelia]|uniref:TmcB/TmcC TPR repeats domain-containing protein n=1 Tax=Paramecium pentaurelia TaxID=43138 RepID=A0A8S1WGX2_9CILI|nr:unnamed protein product [Paramecium pentaurelia]